MHALADGRGPRRADLLRRRRRRRRARGPTSLPAHRQADPARPLISTFGVKLFVADDRAALRARRSGSSTRVGLGGLVFEFDPRTRQRDLRVLRLRGWPGRALAGRHRAEAPPEPALHRRGPGGGGRGRDCRACARRRWRSCAARGFAAWRLRSSSVDARPRRVRVHRGERPRRCCSTASCRRRGSTSSAMSVVRCRLGRPLEVHPTGWTWHRGFTCRPMWPARLRYRRAGATRPRRVARALSPARRPSRSWSLRDPRPFCRQR